MIKKIVSYAILGMGIGSPIFTACLWLGGNDSAGLRDTTAWLAASAVYGMLSLIYEADGLKLPVKVGLHALLCGLISLAVGRFLGYGESLGTLFLGMAPVLQATDTTSKPHLRRMRSTTAASLCRPTQKPIPRRV